MHPPVPAPVAEPTVVSGILDPGTFEPWTTPLPDVAPRTAYALELAAARTRTGLDEAVVTGEGLLRGHRVAVLATDFAFLGGSIGVAAAHRLTTAVEEATRRRLPLLAVTASGGTRMQEGTLAFVQMVKIAAAISDHKHAGLPYLVYLRHPTTGGVFASWASMGHLTFAEPGALIGFLGPRIQTALTDKPIPANVQRAEHLYSHGLVDAVVTVDDFVAAAGAVIDLLLTPSRPRAEPTDRPTSCTPWPPAQTVDGWQAVLASRDPHHLDARTLLPDLVTDQVVLHGSGEGDTAAQITTVLGRIGGIACAVLAHTEHPPGTGLDAAAVRTARRVIGLADELALPLVTVIDISGGQLTAQAEEQGIAGQIARCLTGLVTSSSATVAILLGQGSGGAALAWLPADRVIAVEHSWLSPLAPEAASMLIHRDAEHAPEAARALRIHAAALAEQGIVDHVVPTTGDVRRALGEAVARALRELARHDRADRYRSRRHRYRMLGLHP